MTRLVRGSRVAPLLLSFALLAGLTACGDDGPYAAYCEDVEAQQEPLSEALAAGGPTALIDALPGFRVLQDSAPRDISDDWDVLVGRIESLLAALDAAGVDPASYDRDAPPEDLSQEDRTAIDAAAGELSAPAAVAAFENVQQQARDVCQTPLSL